MSRQAWRTVTSPASLVLMTEFINNYNNVRQKREGDNEIYELTETEGNDLNGRERETAVPSPGGPDPEQSSPKEQEKRGQ